jgi:hypothetical protein
MSVMASVGTALRYPADIRHDQDGGLIGLVGGVGILFVQGCAIIPGLLPCLLLALPLVVPVVVLGLVAGVIAMVPLGIWRLVTR